MWRWGSVSEAGQHRPALQQGARGTLSQSLGRTKEEKRTQAEGWTPGSRADLPNHQKTVRSHTAV